MGHCAPTLSTRLRLRRVSRSFSRCRNKAQLDEIEWRSIIGSIRVSDLTVEELRELIRSVVREALQEERARLAPEEVERNPQLSIFDIPPLYVDLRHPALTMLSREDMYGDGGR
jgi:hypothetical protein